LAALGLTGAAVFLIALGVVGLPRQGSAPPLRTGADRGGQHAEATAVGRFRSPYAVQPSVRLEVADPRNAPRAGHRTVRSAAAGRPTELVVPALGVAAPVVPISAPSGVLVPPSDPQMLGWWSAGAVPGAGHGGALITGHTVHTGGGAFDDLDTLKPGDRVAVRTLQGRIRYTVTSVRVYRKASLAEHAQQVFSQSGPGRLVLVTCDDWTGTEYLSNAVVIAQRA
jgi:LPXTG-site transpeptidase (sortase) family protein